MELLRVNNSRAGEVLRRNVHSQNMVFLGGLFVTHVHARRWTSYISMHTCQGYLIVRNGKNAGLVKQHSPTGAGPYQF